MKKVGIISDLHLEGSNIEINNPGWDVLVLAGDISSQFSILDNFFSYQCPQDIPIIYVLGNHEYEKKIKTNVVSDLKEMLKDFKHVHILQNESIVVEGMKFIGTTLWSNFEGSGITYKKEVMEWAKKNIVDFSHIYVEQTNSKKYKPWQPKDMENEFTAAYNFLNYELKRNPFDGPKVVVTHFAPTQSSCHPKFKDQLMSAYWVNELSSLMGFSEYWLHGHTHNSFNYNADGTQVICNPRGYSKLFNMAQNESFDKTLTLSIDVPTPRKKIKP